MQLPKNITKTLYVKVGLGLYNHGDIDVTTYNQLRSTTSGFETKTISQFDVDIDLPEKFDAESAMIEILTAQKTKLEADHYVAVKAIDDKIKDLLSISDSGAKK